MIARSSLSNIEHVWSADPALDHDADGFVEKWKAHLRGAPASTLPCVVGDKLTVFKLRPLDSKGWRRVLPLPAVDSDYECVALCLVGIDGLTIDGAPFVVETSGNRVTEKCLSAIYDPGLFHELASKIAEASQLLPFRG